MRQIDDRAIRAHADRSFRSEYDYALFEYDRSAKVLAFWRKKPTRSVGIVGRRFTENSWTQDIVIGHVQYALAHQPS